MTNILNLPNEIILNICSRINDKDKFNLLSTCKRLAKFIDIVELTLINQKKNNVLIWITTYMKYIYRKFYKLFY